VRSRHLTTAVTLLVLVGILIAGLYFGVTTLFAPLPGDEEQAADTCETTTVSEGRQLRSRQVVVNVYNAGTRSGLAGETMEAMTARGFRPGETGNAPSGSKVRRAQVWIVEGEEDAGRLVARNLGPKTPVKVRDDISPGIEVIVADNLRGLAKPKRAIRARSDLEFCAPSTEPVVG
jgi:hypothetical protein